MNASDPEEAKAAWWMLPKPLPKDMRPGRSGFTKNKGLGQSKQRRRMVKASRRQNRSKRKKVKR